MTNVKVDPHRRVGIANRHLVKKSRNVVEAFEGNDPRKLRDALVELRRALGLFDRNTRLLTESKSKSKEKEIQT